jgi:hypothetical protein
MFVQIIIGSVKDPEVFLGQSERWPAELKPGATGYLGCTWGIAADGTGVIAARFASADDAKHNADRPEQGEWWRSMEPAIGDATFQDCATVDTFMGGGSDAAGFVQVIRGRVKNETEARTMMDEAQEQLRSARPDILGGIIAWHGDGGGFTQLMYFRSEADAHAGERDLAESDVDERYREMMATPPTFVDLTEPHFD